MIYSLFFFSLLLSLSVLLFEIILPTLMAALFFSVSALFVFLFRNFFALSSLYFFVSLFRYFFISLFLQFFVSPF